MKILQVIPYFVPAYSYGGPVKVCFDISKKLVKNGHQVTVATTDALDNKKRVKKIKENIEGIEIVRFRNLSNWLAKKYNGFFPISFYFWARKNIKKFDFVHCHDFFTLQNIITAYLCKKYNIPFVVQPHGALSPVRQDAKFSKTKTFFLKLFNDILENSKKIIALTKNEKNEIISISKNMENKITVIPNGLRFGEFENISKIDLYKKFNIPRENKIIGYIGRIQHIKGLDISLEILNSIKNKLPFTFLIIGPDEGEEKKLLKIINKLGLKKNVIFTGILKGEEKLETIKSCDLFLFTSRNEGLPITVLEVAALGVPQIISQECNVPEIKKYEAGFELSLKDKNIFKEKILLLLNNYNLHKKISENSKKMVRNIFDINSICNKIEKILKS